MVCDVQAFNKISSMPLDSTYVDFQQHLPLPEKLEDYELPNGLKLKATKPPLDYRITYQGIDDTDFDWTVTSLMEPYDIHDPDMDPMAEPASAKSPESTGFGAAYTAHFDMTVAVKGKLSLGQQSYSIDCVATMDHSWGPRPETDFSSVLWVNAHFSDRHFMHAIFSYDSSAPEGQQHQFRHGYVMVDGELRGAIAGTVSTQRKSLYPTATEMSITDVQGNEHKLTGEMLNHHPWLPYSNCLSPMAMARWEDESGAQGFGTYLEGLPLNNLRR